MERPHNNISIHVGSAAAFVCILLLCIPPAYADEVHLKNSDRITGKIVEESDTAVSIETEAMGVVSVQKECIDHIARKEAIAKRKKEDIEITTDGEVALGYNTNRGNTETEEISARVYYNRNRKHVDEWTLKGDLFYAEADKKMNAQKWYGMGRYAFSFGPGKAWYAFGRIESDHDRFANINYRMIPATGVGYWFFDLPDMKLMAEGAVGLEYTDFRDDTKDSYAAVLIPRGYGEIRLFDRLTLSEDIYYYPAINEFTSYRIHAETACTVDITGRVALRVSLINDYNSKPPDDTRKNDVSLISSLVLSF